MDSNKGNMEVATTQQKQHFVLVHGAGHGAWCWYKLITLLESAGHRVTALDLSASGINPRNVIDLRSFYDYTLPLLELLASVPPQEKVILVGHSLGGLNIALAMDNYPQKILLGVFLNALMPDTVHPPSYVYQQYLEQFPPDFLDSTITPYISPEGPETLLLFGPRFLAENLYQLSPTEDLQLAKVLVRPVSEFLNDLSRSMNFSKEGYGSVERVYMSGTEDKVIPLDFQRWLIENFGVSTVKLIKDADHMVMISKPKQLCQFLQEIADTYTSSI